MHNDAMVVFDSHQCVIISLIVYQHHLDSLYYLIAMTLDRERRGEERAQGCRNIGVIKAATLQSTLTPSRTNQQQ
jgi:hypothetical protein